MSDLTVDILSWLDDAEPVSMPVTSARADTLTSTHASGMCFEVSREVLLSVLSKAVGVVPAKDMVPVLTNFHVTADEGLLRIAASSTNMALTVQTSQVTVKTSGTALIPARTFLSIVRECAQGSTVYVEVTVHGLVVVANQFTAEIDLPAGNGFPYPDDVSNIDFHEIDRQPFLSAIDSVKYALPGRDYSGQDALRMISIRAGKFVACDGSRFHQVKLRGFNLSMQLPSDRIGVLVKVLTGTDLEKVEVGELPGKLVFRIGPVTFYINKLQDAYPNVEQLRLRPALNNDQVLLVDRQELITAIKQVKIATDSTYHAIGMNISSDTIELVAKDTNRKATATVACKWEGKPRTIAVNYIHLAEMLKSYEQKECHFLLGTDTKTYKSPILLKDVDTQAMATISQLLTYRAGLS